MRRSVPRAKDRESETVTPAERVEWAIVAVLDAARRQAAAPEDRALIVATNARVRELDALVQVHRRLTVVGVSLREAPL